ncbi:M20 family metallopeptidase [Siccirubricoccus sp. KC 17139]|uniref:M20 family metallopeptidase n=1 Tax=Siccirubricoccus soli TaxID=2899147 RepID=A0ABT1DAS5_9PROT|nr:M20 aminoacylase family protein [Siccirubricoccus soli]MCO6418345.1 M20 family metallopeptidase [Siccirubricoccus soli]MCP2684480.1 M20 family metallopeptidase [Siccirubricoccus soli]
MPVLNRIADFTAEMTEWRQDFHRHPELGFQETRTSDIVAARLASWGIEVHRNIATTGLVGVLRNGDSGRSIGLRADMDCLPMEEQNGFAHRSTIPGRMHGCGHDGHTATLLGAAKYLAETRNFNGTVHFIFQPAEEGGGGARVMVEEGLFRRFPCDAVYGVHNDPSLPLGEAAAVPGVILAASDRVEITVRGVGGHAARPHVTIDPVLVGAQIVVALQSVVARRTDPLDSAVISMTNFHAGSAVNVIPDSAVLKGSIRTLRPETRDLMEKLITQVAQATAAAHEAVAEVKYVRNYPPTVNHAAETERAALAAAKVLGEERVLRKRLPVMGAEDFSFMLLERPGAFVKIGQKGAEKGGVPVHHPLYDFNDDALPIGASFFATLVEQELPRG